MKEPEIEKLDEMIHDYVRQLIAARAMGLQVCQRARYESLIEALRQALRMRHALAAAGAVASDAAGRPRSADEASSPDGRRVTGGLMHAGHV